MMSLAARRVANLMANPISCYLMTYEWPEVPVRLLTCPIVRHLRVLPRLWTRGHAAQFSFTPTGRFSPAAWSSPLTAPSHQGVGKVRDGESVRQTLEEVRSLIEGQPVDPRRRSLHAAYLTAGSQKQLRTGSRQAAVKRRWSSLATRNLTVVRKGSFDPLACFSRALSRSWLKSPSMIS
jgi:hypothetical protein